MTRRPGRLAAFAHWPVRRKLQAMVLLPLLGVLPLLGAVLLVWGNAAFDQLLITKIRADLSVARGYFDRVLTEVAASAVAVADSQALHAAFVAPSAGQADGAALRQLLAGVKRREGLDFIHLRRLDGSLVAADVAVQPGLPAGASAAASAPAAPSVPTRVSAAVAVWAPEAQALLAEPLRRQVQIPLLATRNAQPTDRTVEDRAMVVHARAPVRDAAGRVVAMLEAGVLLNRNLGFIDHINGIVYPEGALPFGSRGTATLFLDDVRISTNVRLFAEGETRAIGTRVSHAVRDAVLDQGRTWLGRAFVVSDWYVSAYEPLHDAAGRRVGMLYVGYSESPYTWVKYGVLAGIGCVFFAVMIAAALWSARLARQIFHPLERMADTMARIEGGQSRARVGAVASRDEVGALAGHLDHLLDTLAAQTAELQRWNAELDAKVAQRTAELAAAQQQLVRAEKMAAVGQLTASIAHEVNNPIAVIQGNLDLVRELLGRDAARVADELTLVDQQIERMRLIVTQLLQFARPTEYAGYVEAVDPGRALEDCLVLTGHLLSRTQIRVVRDHRASRSAGINRQELQQVLVNLIVNAIQAMPEGGTLTLSTSDWTDPQGRPGVRIDVADTGPGFDEGLLRELFQPFVTRKKDGTGLGLWISRSIVERYGGDLRAANLPGEATGSGAVMTVLLLTEPDVPVPAALLPGGISRPALPPPAGG